MGNVSVGETSLNSVTRGVVLLSCEPDPLPRCEEPTPMVKLPSTDPEQRLADASRPGMRAVIAAS